MPSYVPTISTWIPITYSTPGGLTYRASGRDDIAASMAVNFMTVCGTLRLFRRMPYIARFWNPLFAATDTASSAPSALDP